MKESEIRTFPLSDNQRNIWNVEQTLPNTPVNQICTTLIIDRHFDIQALRQALNTVLMNDETLRTRLLLQQQQPEQYFAAYQPQRFPLYDFSQSDEAALDQWEQQLARQPMPLINAPLVHFFCFQRGQRGGVVIRIHHLISDGWTQVLLSNRISRLYLQAVQGQPLQEEPMTPYREYLEQQQRYRQSRRYQKDREYWQKQIRKLTPEVSLCDTSGGAQSHSGQRLSVNLPEALGQQLQAFCLKQQLSPFIPFLMALAVVLVRCTQSRQLTLGVPILNRGSAREKRASGMYVSTMPLILDIDDQQSVEAFCQQLNDEWYTLMKHQKFPFEHIAAMARQHHPERAGLFQIALSWQNGQMIQDPDSPIRFHGRWQYSGCQTEELCLHLNNREQPHHFQLDLDARLQSFSTFRLQQLATMLQQVLADALDHPQKPLWRLKLTADPAFAQAPSLPVNQLEGMMSRRWPALVKMNRCRSAMIWRQQRIRFDQLDLDLRKAAAWMNTLPNPNRQRRIALILPRSAALISAMMAALYSGSCWIVLDPVQPEKRLQQLLQQCQPDAVIAGTQDQQRLDPQQRWRWLSPEQWQSQTPAEKPAALSLQQPAYIVFTSGTTGTPKGVVISRRSLFNFIEGMKPIYPDTPILTLGNPAFDAFLIESIIALFHGRTLVLAEDREAYSAGALARLISEYDVGMISLTPSRLQAYLSEASFCQAIGGLKCILCGGEAFSPALLSHLAQLTCARIVNQYGPSEATVGVSYAWLNETQPITAGKPMPGCQLFILDAHRQPLPRGVTGELYLGGEGLALGYDQLPQLTCDAFVELEALPGQRVYRTGDRALLNERGELILRGRADRQLKLNGRRIEPEEISAQLCRLPSIREAYVDLAEESSALTAWFSAEQTLDPHTLQQALAQTLPASMIPAFFVQVDQLPLSANGKLDPRKLPQPVDEPSLRRPPANAQERWLLEEFRRVLQNDQLQPDSDFFAAGGDSLKALELIARIEQHYAIRFSTDDFYQLRTAANLATQLSGPQTPAASIPAAPQRDRYPLTFQQQSIYAQLLLNPDQDPYHMPGLFLLPPDTDLTRLKAALQQLCQDEEALQMAFVRENGQLFFTLNPHPQLDIREARWHDEANWSEWIQPFQLDQAPLMHVVLLHGPSQTGLFLDTHHLISDGLSTALLMKKLDQYYSQMSSSSAAARYRDLAWWQHQKENDSALSYWRQALKEESKPVLLPTDRFEQTVQGGQIRSLPLKKELSDQIDQFCRDHQLTAASFFAAALALVIWRHTQQTQFCLGTPLSGRSEAALWETIGLLMNPLPLPVQLHEEQTGLQLIHSVRQTFSEIQDHQNISLQQIGQALHRQPSSEGNGFYRMMFSMRPIEADRFVLDQTPLTFIAPPSMPAKLPLSVEIARQQQCWHCHLEYDRSLFRPQTIDYYLRCLRMAAMELLRHSDRPLAQLNCLDEADRYQLLQKNNCRRVPYLDLPLDRQIRQLALSEPDQPALLFHSHTLTRAELQQQVQRIQALLQQHISDSQQAVALLCDRSEQLIAAMLAIMAAGHHYVMLDPELPDERIALMLEQTQACAVLCDAAFQQRISTIPAIDVRTPCNKLPSSPPRSMEDLHYILFTSGSTGQPKGAMITHRNTASFLEAMRPLIGDCHTALCATNPVFDIFLTESLIALALGAAVVLADGQQMTLPWQLARLIRDHHCDFIQFTPTRMQLNMNQPDFASALSEVKVIIHVGEVLPAALVRRTAACTPARIYNCYGPTETTVYATAAEVSHSEVTLGIPLANTRVLICDSQHRRCLPMQEGELIIEGEGVGAGYVRQPQRSAEVFSFNPQFPHQRQYRTGDLGRINALGMIEFLGRKDQQIKLNGHRIELDEIRHHLQELPGVRQAAVIALKDHDQIRELQGFVCADSQFDASRWRQQLAQALPSYMIPAALTQLSELPQTPTGKLDVQALQTLARSSPTASPAACAPSEDPLAKLWQTILQKETIDPELSFFDQGGSSLQALMLLSEYYSRGLSMTLQEFYEAPTLQQQRKKLLGCQTEQTAWPLQGAVIADLSCPLISGGSGFFGLHLIEQLLQGPSAYVVVLSRQDKNVLLKKAAALLGDNWCRDHEHQLHCLRCDWDQPQLGLSQSQIRQLRAHITCLIHGAADVRHYGNRETLLHANLQSTRAMIELALAMQRPLIHLSTLSISGDRLQQGQSATFTESDLDIGQDVRQSPYLESKFLAEQEIRQACQRGLQPRILRIGRLCGRHRDGQFQLNASSNAFWRLCQGILEVGAVSETMLDIPLEVTAVDECARAALAVLNTDLTTAHLYNPHKLKVSDLFAQLPVLPPDVFAALVRQKAAAGSDLIGSVIEQMSRSPSTITVLGDHTLTHLASQGYFWPLPDPAKELRDHLKKRGEPA